MNKPENSDREYPYVDEHEFNCEYVLKNTGEEKPN